jgi:hypothetical protein
LEVRSRSVAGCLHGLRGRERTTRGEPWRFLWIFRRDNKDHRLAGCVGAVWSRLCRACSTGKIEIGHFREEKVYTRLLRFPAVGFASPRLNYQSILRLYY